MEIIEFFKTNAYFKQSFFIPPPPPPPPKKKKKIKQNPAVIHYGNFFGNYR